MPAKKLFQLKNVLADDNGCRIYDACDQLLASETDHLGVDTQVYHRTNPKPVPIPPAGVVVHAGQSTHKASGVFGCSVLFRA